MSYSILQQQFERLSRDPGDPRLLKGLAVELGAVLVRGCPEEVRRYRTAAVAALRAVEGNRDKAKTLEGSYALGMLAAVIDAAACAEGSITAARRNANVMAVASRPLHRQLLRALFGAALTAKELTEQLGGSRSEPEVKAALEELTDVELIGPQQPPADRAEDAHRLTLDGVKVLDKLPEDEPVVVDPYFLNCSIRALLDKLPEDEPVVRPEPVPVLNATGHWLGTSSYTPEQWTGLDDWRDRFASAEDMVKISLPSVPSKPSNDRSKRSPALLTLPLATKQKVIAPVSLNQLDWAKNWYEWETTGFNKQTVLDPDSFATSGSE